MTLTEFMFRKGAISGVVNQNIFPVSFKSGANGNIRLRMSTLSANVILTLVSKGNGVPYSNGESMSFTGATSGATGTGTAVVVGGKLTDMTSTNATDTNNQFILNEVLILTPPTSTANTARAICTSVNVSPSLVIDVSVDDQDSRTILGTFAVANTYHTFLIPAIGRQDYNFSLGSGNTLNSLAANYES